MKTVVMGELISKVEFRLFLEFSLNNKFIFTLIGVNLMTRMIQVSAINHPVTGPAWSNFFTFRLTW